MIFSLGQCIEILERTPHTLEVLLGGLSDEWINSNEGPDTWSPYDVIGHLIYGERQTGYPEWRLFFQTGS